MRSTPSGTVQCKDYGVQLKYFIILMNAQKRYEIDNVLANQRF